jgi:Zn-dependent protease
MSSPQTFNEDGEKIYQATRLEFLGLPPQETGADEAIASAADAAAGAKRASDKRWWILAVIAAGLIILALLSAALAPLFNVDREAFLALVFGFAFGILAIAGVTAFAIWVVRRIKGRRAAAQATLPRADPPKPWPAWVTFLVTFGGFIVIGLASFGVVDLAWLVGTLLFHEAGHFVGMRYFDYKDVKMFFIPALGAAVRGEKNDVPAWQEAIVLLLGPLPGLLLGCSFYFIDSAVSVPALRDGAAWLVTINFLNLMPLSPLDGGRLWNRLLFSRYAVLESVIVVPAAVGLVFVCLDPGWICLGLSAVFALMMVPAFYKTARAAAVLQARWPELPADAVNLGDEQLRVLFNETRKRFAKKDNTAQMTNAYHKALATQMKGVYRRALLRPAPAAVAVCFGAVYVAAIGLTMATASATHLGTDAGRWPVQIRKKMTEAIEPPPAPETKEER